MRPIVSSIGTFNYKLSRLLVQYLTHLVHNEYSVKNTACFAKVIKNSKFGRDIIMTSFDIVFLFTNIILIETNKIAMDELFKSDLTLPSGKNIFRKLLDVATSHCVFLFGGVLYKQIDGCSMGGPLSISH